MEHWDRLRGVKVPSSFGHLAERLAAAACDRGIGQATLSFVIYGLALLGAIVGASVLDEPGILVGGAIGVLVGVLVPLRRRVDALERRLQGLEALEAVDTAVSEPRLPDARAIEPPEVPQPQAPPVADEMLPAAPALAAAVAAEAPEPAGPSPIEQVTGYLRELFLGGNTVVRVGILVLLVGVTLLLQWAVDRDYISIELRMILAAAIGLALVVLGYRARLKRPGFGQTLQGGGVAVMYLVIFFSFRTYGLLPASLTFALLVAVAVASGALAVLQDALSLIVIAEIGGFMAPILASTGEGNHVVLFSYYLVLNLAVFGVAWFKSWRLPNLLGFLFTFGVGTTWGVLRYEPEHFWTTEPFLIAFFALYLAIPVLFAVRNPDHERGWVDGTLVFGTPLATLGLQHALVQDVRFGMAFSTLALAVVYVGVAWLLYKRAPNVLRALAEAFLAIGVGFATLAIPYGFDNHNLTGATWALEGAGLYWIGVRQNRWLSRVAGAALQVLGSLAVLWQAFSSPLAETALPFANTQLIGAFLVCVASLFVARQAYVHRGDLLQGEWIVLQCLIGWGLPLWLFFGLVEIDRTIDPQWLPAAVLVFVALTGLTLELVGRRFDWLPGRYPAALLIPLLPLLMLWWRSEESLLFFSTVGAVGWPVYLGALLLGLKRFVPDAPDWCRQLHPLALWSLTAFLSMFFADGLMDLASLNDEWWASIFVGTCAALTGAVMSSSGSRAWPFRDYGDLYQGVALNGLVAFLLVSTLALNAGLTGDTPPLGYLPILNPIDVAQLTALLVVFAWATRLRRVEPSVPRETRILVAVSLGVASFAWFNGMLVRTVHHYADVPLSPEALWDSVPLQVAVSVSWTLIGLGVAVWSTRKGLRAPWIVGAALLGVVVVKLFLVDLAQLSTPAKIGTFLVVGALLLLVGYLSPVPPARSTPSGGPLAPNEAP
jgi:uncharacterized membrane protein